jgi:MFS family permease
MTIADTPRRAGLLARLPILAPLRHRAFRLLFAGQIVSDCGDWLDALALLTLIVYRWQLGPGALAALTMVYFLPSAILGPLTGVLVDRWPRRATMIGSDLARAAIVLGLIWAPNLPTLLALVLARAICSTFFSPARQATIQVTVAVDDLLAANALSRLSVNVTKVLGPGIGGLLVVVAGVRPAFLIDAATFLVSAALLSRLSPNTIASPAVEAAERHFWREWRAGAAAILARRALTVAVGALAAEMAIVEINDSLTTLAFKGLGLGSALLGLALGASGLGNVLGALGIGQWGQRVQSLGLTAIGLVLVGGVETALGGALIFNIGRGGVG